ncbi:SET domain-containing protein-lysine N-methyltransferase [Spirosoma taeanense]|uniref:SET domain-containing protein-lysine N-methyltransferase n=1 Tax=Spirosoma taeanense TaxID=2735870 RepID=A0A6M5Y8E0_9BACT|nr:SET domain-containing protein-lysine N-methyltransferase [Spirosoma taeanense]QJW90169.1 SET domain-containing protein-lysine N-methyltransferase [Spirosoma taeanense]
MIHFDTYVKHTPKGLGLFAKRRLERGTILWIIDDLDVKIPLVDYLSMDEFQRRKLDIYSYLDYENRVIIPWDEGKYVNHSCAPNSTGILDFDNISVALRTIEPDEEIVEDYYSYYGHFETFQCRCGASNCRGIISQVDSYRPDLRMRLQDVSSLLLSLPQSLLNVRSSESDKFVQRLHAYAPIH